MKYQAKKEKARQLAVNWQQIATEKDRDYAYFCEWNERFNRIGKKYWLVREFKENAII